MTHTSGMHCQNPPGFGDLGRKKDRTLAEAVIAFSQQPLDTQPGTVWKYCGTAFDTLGRVVEVASGKSLRGVPERAGVPPAEDEGHHLPADAGAARSGWR